MLNSKCSKKAYQIKCSKFLVVVELRIKINIKLRDILMAVFD